MESPQQLTAEATHGAPRSTTPSVTDAGTEAAAEPEADAGAPVADAAPAADTATPAPTAEMSDTFILESIANGRYARSPFFTHVTNAPFPSAVTTGSTIEEWVSSKGYQAYTAIEPDKTGSDAQVPQGTIIVREVRGADGTITKLTLMAKGPAGYNPALGDWWFGVTDADGTPQQDDAGPITGRLSQCFSCHIPRKSDAWLFGVLPADRATKH